MAEIEEAPVEAAARTAAPRDEGEDLPAPTTLRGATSVLLRKVFRRTSAEIPHNAGRSPAATPERTGVGRLGGWFGSLSVSCGRPRDG